MKKTLLLGICVAFAGLSLAQSAFVSVPSDPNANYYVLEKGGKGNIRTIVNKRVGPRGTSYSKREYDCRKELVRYLATGDSLDEYKSSVMKDKFAPVAQGSIAYHISVVACYPP
ncbi:hypothetical protein GN316_06535 [Xylophilus sp. Kf1]|nr:hypothetical protein [Xylophilus sp. Kf1]